MTVQSRHVSWASVRDILDGDVAQRIAIAGNPPMSIEARGGKGGLFLLAPFVEGCAPLVSSLEFLKIVRIQHGAEDLLQIGTTDPSLFSSVLVVLCDIADAVQADGASLPQAVSETIDRWRGLLAPTSVLSPNAEIGLIGEIALLWHLVTECGPHAVDMWLGPTGELHDFSLPNATVEVKTTLGRERTHHISDLRQLVPNLGVPLYLLSIQLRPTVEAAGNSLPELVDRLMNQLLADAPRRAAFVKLLAQAGYNDVMRDRYSRRFGLRTAPVLVEVDAAFPKIVPELISRMIGEAAAHRLRDISYSVNVDGMGYEAGTPEYGRVLPLRAWGGLK